MAVNIFRDVTEQRQAEEERARLAAIVESSDDAIISKTLDGTITSWNKGAERIYGYSAEETVGRPISMLVPPDRPDEIPSILESLRRGEKIDNFETVRVTKDGRRLDISLTISPITNSSGEIVGASTIARDITERKRAEEERDRLRAREIEARTQKEVRRRIARDLHDVVLQDLAGVLQSLRLTYLQSKGSELGLDLEEELEALGRATLGLRKAVHDLRGEKERPLVKSVESLVELNRRLAADCNIDLVVEEGLPNGLPGEVGVELLRVIREALTNARHHSGAKSVAVTLKVEGSDLVAEISDDGQGFALEGTPGVGLSSMQERAAIVDGRLEIESEVGQGTSVRLQVPVPQTE